MNYTRLILFFIIETAFINKIHSRCCKNENCSCKCQEIIYEEDKDLSGRKKLINDVQNTKDWYIKEEGRLISNFNTLIMSIADKKNIEEIANTMSNHEIGIPDLANTCYINVIMQMISHSKIFVSKIINKAIEIYENDKNTSDNKNIKTHPMISCLAICIMEIYNAQKYKNGNRYDINRIKNAIRKLIYFYLFNKTKCDKNMQNNRYKAFKIPNQNDAEEFLTLLLSDIEQESEGITNFLNITNQITLKCSQCKQENTTQDDQKLHYAYTNLIKELSDITKESKENINYRCNNCDKENEYERTEKITETNDIIFIIINRIDIQTNESTTQKNVQHQKKIDKQITLNEEITINSKKYTLKSYTEHNGSTLGGHYSNFTKTDKSWLNIEDNKVFNTDYNPKSQNVYIIMYEKKES